MNQSKLEMVKKEMARMNIDILGISSVQFSSVARSCATLCNPMNSMKRQKDRTLKDELPRLVDVQYATEKERKNNSRKNKETEPKQKQHPVVDVPGGDTKYDAVKSNTA